MNSEVPIQRSSRILTLPNVLTLIRLCCIPLVLLFMWQNDLRWALILFLTAGVTDFFDGLTARWLRQQSMLGMYLDPIADKLLLSSSFLVLALTRQIPWIVSGMVLVRDAGIIIICVILMATTQIRRFPPSALGKINTTVQLGAVLAVMLDAAYPVAWVHFLREVLVVLTPVFLIASSAHYAWRIARQLRRRPAASTSH